MYTHSAAGCWQGPTSSSSIPKPTGHSPPSPVSRVPGRKLSPQPVPAAPGGPACAVCVQQGWAGDGSVLPGRDFLLLLPGSPFICPELMAELLPSPLLPVPCPVCAAIPISPSQWDQPPTLYLHLQALCGGSGMSQSPAKGLTHSSTGQAMRRYWWPEDRRTWDALQLGLAPICGQSGSSPGHQGAARTLKHGFPSHWLLHSIQPPPVLEGAGHRSYQSQGLTPTSLLRSPQSSGAGAERSNRPSSAAGLTPGGEQEIVPGRCSARG